MDRRSAEALPGHIVVIGPSGRRVVDKRELEEIIRTESEHLVGELALEIWRARRRFSRLAPEARANAQSAGDSITRLEDILTQYDVTYQVHDRDAYDPGLALEVLETRGTATEHQIILETVSPTVLWHGRVLRRAQVVIGAADA